MRFNTYYCILLINAEEYNTNICKSIHVQYIHDTTGQRGRVDREGDVSTNTDLHNNVLYDSRRNGDV